MALDHLRESLLAEAGREADDILAEARAKSAERLKTAEHDLRSVAEVRYRARLEAIEEEKRQALARKRTEARLRVLERKNALVERAFSRATERLNHLGDEQYIPLVEKWLKRLDGAVGGEVTCEARDRDGLADLLRRVNERRPAAPLTLGAAVLPTGRGFVFRSANFVVDYTLASQVTSLREALVPEVARILFRELPGA